MERIGQNQNISRRVCHGGATWGKVAVYDCKFSCFIVVIACSASPKLRPVRIRRVAYQP